MLRKIILATALALGVVSAAEAQSTVALASKSFGPATVDANGEALAMPDTRGVASIGIQTVGTFTGTLELQCSVDGTNYKQVDVTPVSSQTPAANMTTENVFVAGVGGCRALKVISTAWTSGSVAVTALGTFSGGSSGGGGGGGGGGAVTVADGDDVALGATTDAAATQGSTGTVSAKLRTVTSQLNTANTSLGTLDNAVGTIAPGTAATGGLAVGGIYNATPPTFTDGQGGAIQLDASGNLLVAFGATATVQPGNTANTTPWLFTVNQGSKSAVVLDTGSNDSLAVSLVKSDGTQVAYVDDVTVDGDSGGGTQTLPIVGVAVAASGGAVAVTGDAANGLDVDVTRLPALVAGDADVGNVDLEFAGTAASTGIGVTGSAVLRTVSAQQTIFRSIDLDESEEEVKASAGEVCSLWVTNTATATRWIKFYNATAANTTVGTTTPVVTIGVAGNATDDVSGSFGLANGCLTFDTAISAAATTGVADNDTGAPGANDVIVMIGYR